MILTSRSRATGLRSDIFSRHYFDDTCVKITGQYSVVLPDCRIQTVTYSVRPETGFVVSITPEEDQVITKLLLRPRCPIQMWELTASLLRPVIQMLEEEQEEWEVSVEEVVDSVAVAVGLEAEELRRDMVVPSGDRL